MASNLKKGDRIFFYDANGKKHCGTFREYGITPNTRKPCVWARWDLTGYGYVPTDQVYKKQTEDEQMIETLTKKGYKITPPPEPERGEVLIYRNVNDQIWSVLKSTWDIWTKNGANSECKLIAIVPWTEGQGLDA